MAGQSKGFEILLPKYLFSRLWLARVAMYFRSCFAMRSRGGCSLIRGCGDPFGHRPGPVRLRATVPSHGGSRLGRGSRGRVSRSSESRWLPHRPSRWANAGAASRNSVGACVWLRPALGLLLDRGRGPSRVAARRLRVVWSGTGRSSPSRCMTEPIRPSVWCSAKRNTGPKRQSREDGELRVPGLPAPGGARLSPPGRDCLIGEPDRQAAALTQAGVIGGPVRDLAPLSGNVVAAALVQLERQGGHPRADEGCRPTPPPPSAPTT